MGVKAYDKPWRSIPEQLGILKSRGLIINDPAFAQATLSHVNYYRFSGYCLDFEKARHVFQSNVSFEDIAYSYEFDRKLRNIIRKALEIVELDIRTKISYNFGKKYGAFGHVRSGNFYKPYDFEKIQQEANRSNEKFIRHFKKQYNEFPDLLIWVASEIMSFGAISKMYYCMYKQDQKTISHSYNLQPHVLASWLHHLVYVRNLCAHHAKLWSRIWAVKPILPSGKQWNPPFLLNNNRLYATLLILSFMSHKCSFSRIFHMDWKDNIYLLFRKYPNVSDAERLIGLVQQWHQHPVWVL